jgi:hypothetical protein
MTDETSPESKAFQHLARDYAQLKVEREDWIRLTLDMLSVFQDQDVLVTAERVECWCAEWSRISGLDYNEHA